MALGRVAVGAALVAGASAITVRQEPTMVKEPSPPPYNFQAAEDAFPVNITKARSQVRQEPTMVKEPSPPPYNFQAAEDAFPVNITKARSQATVWQWSENRLLAPGIESEQCVIGWSKDSKDSEWQEDDPPVFPEAGIGARRRVAAIDGMEYQLFLPRVWTNNSLYAYPTIIYLHGHAERKFSLMNTESLPRLLARNQSVSFDNRSCWCLDAEFVNATAAKEAQNANGFDSSATVALNSPMADCTFADKFKAIVIMPQGWAKKETAGWDTGRLDTVKNITKYVMQRFNGDANNVIVTGVAEGGAGAMAFAKLGLVSSAIIADSPNTTYPGGMDGLPFWVTSDKAGGTAGTDALVKSLIARTSGITRYTRYEKAPKAADPYYGGKWGHASDLLYRYPALWQWAFRHKTTGGRTKWGLELHDYIVMR